MNELLDKGIILTFHQEGKGHRNSSSSGIESVLYNCTISLKDKLAKDKGFAFFIKEIKRNKYFILIQIEKIPNKDYNSIATVYSKINDNNSLYKSVCELIYNVQHYQSSKYLQTKSSSIRTTDELNFIKESISEKEYYNINYLEQLFLSNILCDESLTLDVLHSIKYFRDIESLLISNLPRDELELIFYECNLENCLNKKIDIKKDKEGLLKKILYEEKNNLCDIQKNYLERYEEPTDVIHRDKSSSKITYDKIHQLFHQKDEDAKFYVIYIYQYLEENSFDILELHKILEIIYDREWNNQEIKEYIENKILEKCKNDDYIHIGRSSNRLTSSILDNFMNLSDNKKDKIVNSPLREVYLTSMIKALNHSFSPHKENSVLRILEITLELNKIFLAKDTIEIMKMINLNLIKRCINSLKGARYG